MPVEPTNVSLFLTPRITLSAHAMLALPLVLSGLIASSASAVLPSPVQHYTGDDGLAGAVVRSIERKPDGSMWFACWGRGITTYDGLAWKSYGIEEGLPSLDVRVLRMDALNRLWAGNADGIAVQTGDRWVSLDTGLHKTDPASVFTICPFPDGSLWFGLTEGRIIAYTPASSSGAASEPAGTWSVVMNQELSTTEKAIEGICLRSDGSVLVGTRARGILRFRDGRWFQEPGDEVLENTISIVEAEGGVLYAGGSSGLWRRAPGENSWARQSDTVVRALSPMPDGRIALVGQHMAEYRGRGYTEPIRLLMDMDNLPMQTIRYFPSVGETWVGTKVGVFRLGWHGWTRVRHSMDGTLLGTTALYADAATPATTVTDEGRVFQYVNEGWRSVGGIGAGSYTSIFAGLNDSLWIVERNQAIRWDMKELAALETVVLPPDVENIVETHSGRLFSYDRHTVFERRNGHWVDTPASTREDLEEVSFVMETSSGQLFVSNLLGLSLWDLSGPELRAVHRIETDKNFRGVIEEPDGSLLVGANEEGIYRFQDGEIRLVVPFEKDSSARVRTMTRTSQGRLWVGAREVGIARYYDGRWVTYTGIHGVPPGGTRTIVEDPDGVIWAAIEDVGLMRYIPSLSAPETVIRQVTSQVPHNDHSIFQFEARDPWNISRPSDLVYSWRVRPRDGNDEGGWSPYSPDHSIISPDMSTGDYVFEVRAADTDFNVDPTPARAAFTVLPPLWATTAFLWPVSVLVVAVLAIGGLLARNYAALRASELHLREAIEDARAANEAKSQFLAHVSHEIRTPMNAILGHAQLMKASGDRPDEDTANLDVIATSGDHLLDLIDDVLEMVRIEAGRVAISPGTFNYRQMVNQVVEMLRGRCAAGRVSLLCEVAPTVPEYVVADQGKLRQVLINLLGNAAKFTSEGEIVLRSRVEHRSEANAPVRLFVDIEDTGAGIEPQALGKIFEPFEQSEAGQHRGGAGLGLPICRHHIEAMGGSIHVDSTVGQGTCVHFWVPVQVGRATDVAQEPTLAAPGAEPALRPGVRILVVDDIDTNLTMLEKLLRRFEFDVTGCTSGFDALKAFENEKPDIILMDNAMPGMDGMETTRRIRAMEGGGSIPIIFVTGGALEEEHRAIMASGATDIIRKPFRHGALLEKIRDCLRGED